MSWDIDVPKLPFKKPPQLEELEQMSFEQREAMDFQEVGERIDSAADSLAWTYHHDVPEGGDYEGCVIVVGQALTETGGAIGGKAGAIMVGTSDRSARRACRAIFIES